MNEHTKIKALFEELDRQDRVNFPASKEKLDVSTKPGVYVIRDSENVLHVGRTIRGKGGLRQRLNDHLQANSSFVNAHLNGKGSSLRTGYTYQYLVVEDDRQRALLEHYATALHCPKHLGLGKSGKT